MENKNMAGVSFSGWLLLSCSHPAQLLKDALLDFLILAYSLDDKVGLV